MKKGVAMCVQLHMSVCVCVHVCNFQKVCARQEETVCRATSNLVIIKDPHFTSSLSPSPHFPPAQAEPKQTIRGDYYEEEKRKGLAERSLRDSSWMVVLFWLSPGNWQSLMTTAPLWFKSLCVLSEGCLRWRQDTREDAAAGRTLPDTCWFYYHVYPSFHKVLPFVFL